MSYLCFTISHYSAMYTSIHHYLTTATFTSLVIAICLYTSLKSPYITTSHSMQIGVSRYVCFHVIWLYVAIWHRKSLYLCTFCIKAYVYTVYTYICAGTKVHSCIYIDICMYMYMHIYIHIYIYYINRYVRM